MGITTPPFAHGHLYVTTSRVRDCHNIRLFLNNDQLAPSTLSSTGYMPTVDNIVYQDVVALNSGYTPFDSTTPNPTLPPPPIVQQLQQRQSVNDIVHHTPNPTLPPPPVVQQLQQRQTQNNIVHQDVVVLNYRNASSDCTTRIPTFPSTVIQGGTQLRLNSVDNIGYVYVYIFIPIFIELSLTFIYSTISKA